MARTTSFSVQPNVFFTSFASSSGTRAKATDRCGVSDPFHGVRGALSGTAPTGLSGSRRPSTMREIDLVVSATRRGSDSSRRALDAMA